MFFLRRVFMFVLMLWVGAIYWASRYFVARRRPDPFDSPASYGMNYEEVTFFSHQDRIQLEGWWIPAQGSARGTIIQCHGQNGSMDGDLGVAKMLHSGGYNVLMFDFRAHGRSRGDIVTFGWYEADDLRGAIDMLASSYGTSEVGILAFSMGTLAAMRLAAQDTRIKTMVLDGVIGRLSTTLVTWLHNHGLPRWLAYLSVRVLLLFARYRTQINYHRINGIAWAGQLKNCPTFFIHGEMDEAVPTAEFEYVYANAPVQKILWIAPQCKHRAAHKNYPDLYQSKLLDWFNQHLAVSVV